MKRGLYYFSLCVFLVYLSLVVLDAFLSQRPDTRDNRRAAFSVQYLHPYYFFGFPTRKELLDQLNTSDSWVDQRGFRGPGPEAKGNRKLAFLIGGSTAFGDGATTNEKAITGVLNRIQDKFFFVNAAVPSWNSFQELLRFLKQVHPERPALLVSLTSFNDLGIAYMRRNSEIPVDAPEAFEQLDSWVEDVRSADYRRTAGLSYLKRETVLRHLLLSKLRYQFQPEAANERPFFFWQPKKQRSHQELSKEAAERFLQNMDLIHEMSNLDGIRYFALLQPFRYAPERYAGHTPEKETFGLGEDFRTAYLQYRQAILDQRRPYFRDLTEAMQEKADEWFIDAIHFNDVGYEALAKRIWLELERAGAAKVKR